MPDDLSFAPPAETLTTSQRLAELADILAGAFRAPTRRKRARILPPIRTVRWTFSPSDAVVGSSCETELEVKHKGFPIEWRRARTA